MENQQTSRADEMERFDYDPSEWDVTLSQDPSGEYVKFSEASEIIKSLETRLAEYARRLEITQDERTFACNKLAELEPYLNHGGAAGSPICQALVHTDYECTCGLQKILGRKWP